MTIAINTRALGAMLTGSQRYIAELLRYFPDDKISSIAPDEYLNGIKGHMWEQFQLPSKVMGNLLFSPSNSGPLMVRNQVLTLLDVVPIDHPELLNGTFAKWYRFLIPRLVKTVHHVVTISDFSKSRIIATCGIPESKVTSIPLAVSENFYFRTAVESLPVIEGLKLPTDRFVLCLGSLEPRKNLARLLKAWSLIQDSIDDDIWLIIVGGQGSRNVFQNLALEPNIPRVHFTGHIPDSYLPSLYSSAMMFVYPSFYEGFGLPPLEAMACKSPVIVGNRASLPEVVGKSGMMVNPFDEKDIADKILMLLRDDALRSALAKNGYERSKIFSWQDTAKKTFEILNRYSS